MFNDQLHTFTRFTLDIFASLFVFLIGLTLLALIIVYILDVTQNKQALRRNYPVIGHFRYFF